MRQHHAFLLILIALPLTLRAANITSLTEVDGVAGQALSYQITADNGPTSYSTSGLGSISGLSLDSKTGLISGTPTVAGTFKVTVSAKSKSSTASKRITFIIAKTTVAFTSANTASAAVGIAFSFQLAAPVTNPTYSASGLPSGLKLSSSTGLISGTPTTGGIFAPTVTIGNSTTVATGLLVITVNGGVTAPTTLALTPLNGTVGVAYLGAFSAKGAAPITFTISSPLPPGVMTTNANFLSGTPTTAGVTNLTITATNSFGTVTTTLAFTVAPPNGAPLISSPLAVSADVAESFDYQFKAAGKTPLTFSVDATKLPRGLAQDASGDITGYPFDPGMFNVPVSAANAAGADNEILVITVASLAPGNTSASIKFTDGYRDVKQLGDQVPTSAFNFSALVNTPGINLTNFDSKLSVDVTVGIYEFSDQLGNAARLTPGKSALFNFTASHAGRRVTLGNISFTLLKNSQVKISARRKGTASIGGVQTIRAEQLTGISQIISEMIPVKIQIGSTLLASFYIQCQGTATVKTVPDGVGGTLKLSTVKLKGAGTGTPSN